MKRTVFGRLPAAIGGCDLDATDSAYDLDVVLDQDALLPGLLKLTGEPHLIGPWARAGLRKLLEHLGETAKRGPR